MVEGGESTRNRGGRQVPQPAERSGAPSRAVSTSGAMKHGVRGWSVMLACAAACVDRAPRAAVSVAREPFGTTAKGEAVSVYTLKNAHGMELRAVNYGGIILSLKVPDRNRRVDDVVLGFDS